MFLKKTCLTLGLGLLALLLEGCTGLRIYFPAKGKYESEHLTVRFRPESPVASAAPRVAAAAERELARMSALFQVPNDAKYTLHLFGNDREFHRTFPLPAHVSGFADDAGAFVILDDPTTMHELAHVIVSRRIGPWQRAHPFLVEAMAQVALDETRIAVMHAKTSFKLRHGKVPPLADWYALRTTLALSNWTGKNGPGAYEAGGSWMHFLLQKYGMERLKRYYLTNDTEAAFGAPRSRLEVQWHEWLRTYPLRPAAEAALASAYGMTDDITTIVIAGDLFDFSLDLTAAERAEAKVFQWSHNNLLLPDQTDDNFKLRPAGLSDSGVYQFWTLTKSGARVPSPGYMIEVVDPAIFLPATPHPPPAD